MPKILIVEDSADSNEMYQMIFNRFKFDMATVTTREQLTRQLVLNCPDLILLDIQLNGEDGRKICKEIKLNKEFKNLPIIITSGSSEKLATYHEYLADDILEKPFDIMQLLDKIKLLIDNRETI